MYTIQRNRIRPLGHRGSDAPPAPHSLPLPSILLYDCKKKSRLSAAFLFGGPEENRFSRARRPLGHRGSDAPQAPHSLPLPSILLLRLQKEKPPFRRLSFLVDPRRIELLSEKRSAGLSPSAFRLLKFPPHSAGRQALCFGSFLMRDGVKS